MTERTPKNIAVLMGGWSAEREVSLVSGAGAARALEELGHQVRAIDVQRDLAGLLAALEPRPDVIFNALHGRGGEDGTIQGVLDLLGIPYTHSGVLASAVSMDKPLAKQVLAAHGVRSPAGYVVRGSELAERAPKDQPYIAKPTNEGSTVGIWLVRPEDSPAAAQANLLAERRVLIEDYIPGRELTVGVMGDHAICITEIKYQTDLFDYKTKYTSGQSQHILPADIPQDVEKLIKHWAITAHLVLGCHAISRSDFRWNDQLPGTEGLFFLEINTQPGLTPNSLLPEQAKYAGISYPDLIEWLVEHARCPG